MVFADRELLPLIMAYRDFPPYSRLGRQVAHVWAKNSFWMHYQDSISRQAVNFVFGTLPLGGLFAEENVSRRVEAGREDHGAEVLLVPLRKDPACEP